MTAPCPGCGEAGARMIDNTADWPGDGPHPDTTEAQSPGGWHPSCRPSSGRPLASSRMARRTRGELPQRPPTPAERKVLDAIRFLAVRGDSVRAYEIAARTRQSEQGAAQTTASCVRKGLVARTTGRGHVWFTLTDRGWGLARPRTEQARRAR